MYSTRLRRVPAQDENSRAAADLPFPNKGISKAQNNHHGNNRRALGEIGNLVGALSAGCTLSKDGVQDQARCHQAANAAGEHIAERPITRKFDANLANNVQLKSREVLRALNEVPVSWRIKQRRTVCQPSAAALGKPSAIVSTQGVEEDAVLLPSRSYAQKYPQKASTTHCGLFAVKKKQTLTATLTAQSEAVCRGSEVAMEEAEEPLPNIDAEDVGNPLAVVEYVEDIYAFYRKTEKRSCASPDYMAHQSDINEKMRAILIDWLIEVHLKFKLMPETLYLTVNLIDRYLSCQTITRKNLQLVGVTAMLVACKYEEIWAPEVKDFVFICGDAYTKAQVLDMEKHMLNKLKFNLTVPTPYIFLVRFLKAAHSDNQLKKLASFFTELCLTEYSMMKYCPSLVAAAAVYTAQQTLCRHPYWSTTLERHSGYMETHLRDCALKMVGFHQTASSGDLTVVHRKYASRKFSSVAILSPAVLSM